VAESLNSFDSGLDQGSTFGVEPKLVYERLQTNTQPVKKIGSIADTQCSTALFGAGLHLTWEWQTNLKCTSDSNSKFEKSNFELQVLPRSAFVWHALT